ncbi:hypothetical protein BCR34DRAFT_580056 [Clohesyomyces aquaticus]|uniref:Uncharacterized protein n=1 Tax=Clohesyomyces aquaticus TaxID=1231657 RepID=A0A1Y1Y9P0_9PLEO|nr:hypothetical protein BCR34DRAFT_580056 [Clohesyomyces aquaticus]
MRALRVAVIGAVHEVWLVGLHDAQTHSSNCRSLQHSMYGTSRVAISIHERVCGRLARRENAFREMDDEIRFAEAGITVRTGPLRMRIQVKLDVHVSVGTSTKIPFPSSMDGLQVATRNNQAKWKVPTTRTYLR